MSLIPPLELGRFPPANVLHTQLQLHHQMLYRQHNITHHHHHPAEDLTTNGWLLPPTSGAGPTLPGDVTVSLQNDKLWQQFHAETTEMIITKLGRRMFPSLQLQIEGLERRGRYCLLLEITPASRRRHKYVGGGGENGVQAGNSRGWTSAGPAEPQPHVNRRVYVHPDSPATGTHWMQHPVSFNKLKLTNNAVDHHSNVVLTSMHKYVPKIWIVRCDDIARLTSLFSHPASSFCFPETEFIAVTAYQNENITKLKINNNPFAKGFRETGQSRCKRKMSGFDSPVLGLGQAEDGGAASGYAEEEEEESNMSSSESESNPRLEDGLGPRCQRAKRAASETGSLDDSGVSSSSSTAGSASPPLVSKGKTEGDPASPQPRLHRPWADDETPQVSRPPPPSAFDNRWQQHQMPIFSGPSHRQILPIEFARIQQIHRYQQLQYEQYCHISQLHQLKNLALHFPLHSNSVNVASSQSSSRINKYSRLDISPVSVRTPSTSPSTSQNTAFGSS